MEQRVVYSAAYEAYKALAEEWSRSNWLNQFGKEKGTMTKAVFILWRVFFLLGVLSSIVVASDQPHIVAWDFNDGVQRWWGRGSTAVSHNTFSIFASEGRIIGSPSLISTPPPVESPGQPHHR